MKKYVSPKAQFVEIVSENILTASGEMCGDNYVCTADESCPDFVCPSMYGGVCAENPYG